jgi:hypothetical protein
VTIGSSDIYRGETMLIHGVQIASQLVEQPNDSNITYPGCKENRLFTALLRGRALAREDVNPPLVELAEQQDGIVALSC